MFCFFYRLSRTLRIPLLILLRFDLDLLLPFASELEEPSLLALNKVWPQNPHQIYEKATGLYRIKS